jgi:hypothetical protein
MSGFQIQTGQEVQREGVAVFAPWLRRCAPALAILAGVSTFAGFEVARSHEPLRWERDDSVQASSLLDSSLANAKTGVAAGDVDPLAANLARLAHLPPQEQAERSLVAAIHRDPQAVELIGQSVDHWRGQLRSTDSLVDLIQTAMNSNDLRVRAAALETDLAASNLPKSPESVTRLITMLREHPQEPAWALWRLGALGNRGVEPDLVLRTLMKYAESSNEESRYWAVEGLAALGSDAAVDPLLERFANDPSGRVRQRAACNLAESGMLTKGQRLAAVPDLLNFFENDGLDATTRGWVFGALRLITGQSFGNDVDIWRRWWAQRDTRHHHRTGDAHTSFA